MPWFHLFHRCFYCSFSNLSHLLQFCGLKTCPERKYPIYNVLLSQPLRNDRHFIQNVVDYKCRKSVFLFKFENMPVLLIQKQVAYHHPQNMLLIVTVIGWLKLLARFPFEHILYRKLKCFKIYNIALSISTQADRGSTQLIFLGIPDLAKQPFSVWAAGWLLLAYLSIRLLPTGCEIMHFVW